MNQPDLDLDAILARSQQAYGEVLDHYADDTTVPAAVRQHFNYDVPALIGAVKRLQREYQTGFEHGMTRLAVELAEAQQHLQIVEQTGREAQP
jgi:hypothetical protein